MPMEAYEGAASKNAQARLGKYELVRRLAVGGMAEIFLARVKAVHGFEKLVVVKRILPQYAEDEDFVRMLLDEARLAATLHHPNIVQVYDMGIDEESGQSFFSMEYVRGQDLRRIIRALTDQGRWLSLEHVLNIVIGVAAGLHHAHEQVGLDGRRLEIVHRDVSPSNILVTYAGAVKLVDFGIAKATVAQSTTRHGTLKGKIPYMSPEQCRGERLDRRSDIFSLGTVLWEMSTGHRLWKSDNELATLSRIANEDAPPPSWKKPDYPPELEKIVMKALTRDRDQRYQSAQDLQIDLEEFARENKMAISSPYLARYMQNLFAGEIAREVQAAKGETDKSVQTLLTQDLEFIAPQLLEMEGAKTTEFSPAELAKMGEDDRANTGPQEPDSFRSATHSESLVVGVPGSRSRRNMLTAIGAVVGGLAAVGLGAWLASGDPQEAEAAEDPQEQAAPVAAPAQPEPEPTPNPEPGAQPQPEPQPAAAEPEPAVAEPEPAAKPSKPPVKTKKKTGSKKKKRPSSKKKKKKSDWNRDSPFLPP